VIAKRVPRQLAHQTVVLVKIVPALGEDYIGREDFLEFLEAFFDWRTKVGKESISKGFHNYCSVPRAVQESIRAALGFFGSRCIGTQHKPVKFDPLRLLNHPQQCAATADLDVVAVCAQAQDTLHTI
jgi:hypothetical protein